jgi:putative salt-induced outer membrane protein YdiY
MHAHIRAVALAIASSVLCLWAGVSGADETVIDEVLDNIERGELELGLSGAVRATYFSRRGNSKEEDWGLSVSWKYNMEGPWQFDGLISGMSESTNDSTSDEEYLFRNAAKYYRTDTTYYVGRANYEKDRFAGIEEEVLGVLGYGRELYRRKNHKLVGEAGGGLLWSKDADGESDSGGTAYGAAFYDWQMTEHSTFRQLIGVRYSEFDSNWKLTSKSEVKAEIIGNLSGVFSYEIKRNSEVADGTANSDFYTNFGLEYSF